MQTLSFQAPVSMSKDLERYAKQLDRSKASIIRMALQQYMEDLKDYAEVSAYKRNNKRTANYSLADIKRKHKLK